MNEETESILKSTTELINNVTTTLLTNTAEVGSQGEYNNTSLAQERALNCYSHCASCTCCDLKANAAKIALCYAAQVQYIYTLAANAVALQNAANRLNEIRGLGNINCYTIACGCCFNGSSYWGIDACIL